MQMYSYAYYNGQLGTKDSIKIPLTDRSIYFGDAIYDAAIGRNGKILVWSEKHYDLEAAGFIDEDVYEKLAEIFRERAMPENSPAGFIIHSLKVDELIKLEKIISNYPALHVAVRMQRCCIDDENVKKAAGTFDFKTGRASGGWELEFDHVLRGREGSYRVMRDNNALVIKNSGEIKLMPVPGADVTVDYQGAFL